MKPQLILTNKDCDTITNWFSFVPTTKRTNIDCKLATKINNNKLLFNDSELLMILRWFHECPNNLIDQSDFDLCLKIEPFLLALTNG